MNDLNALDLEQTVKIISGSARSMGIEVKDNYAFKRFKKLQKNIPVSSEKIFQSYYPLSKN